MALVCTCGTDGDGTLTTLPLCPLVDLDRPATCVTTDYNSGELLYLAGEVSSENIGYVFAWGVAAVLGLWVIGYAVGQIKRLLSFV